MKNKISALYKELRKQYGKPEGQWKLWCKRPKTKLEKEKVIMGAILTQRTNWRNVELSFELMRKIGIKSLKDIYNLSGKNFSKLVQAIKPSGFYKTKAKYLFGVAEFFIKNPKNIKRQDLLSLKGVGKETADSILLYALEKPIFVIDEYTRRLVKKKKLAKNLSYDYLQRLFEKNLPRNWQLYQDFHALIVIDGKNKT
jgi:endonuclease-3 related protein